MVFAGFAVFLWYRLVRDAVERIENSAAATERRAIASRMYAILDAEAQDPELPRHAAVRRAIAELRPQNQALLKGLKLILRSGVQRFERMDRASMSTTPAALVKILEAVPNLLAEHTQTTIAIASRHLSR